MRKEILRRVYEIEVDDGALDACVSKSVAYDEMLDEITRAADIGDVEGQVSLYENRGKYVWSFDPSLDGYTDSDRIIGPFSYTVQELLARVD
jgi:hypothetical protein